MDQDVNLAPFAPLALYEQALSAMFAAKEGQLVKVGQDSLEDHPRRGHFPDRPPNPPLAGQEGKDALPHCGPAPGGFQRRATTRRSNERIGGLREGEVHAFY